MNNPRNRDRTRQTPNVTRPGQLPNVPPVRTGTREIDEAFQAIQTLLAQRAGSSGNPWERWATLRDLADRGLTGGTPRTMPDTLLALPVWTSRERFDLVTPKAFAEYLYGLLPSGTTSVDRATVERLIAEAPSRSSGTTASPATEELAAALGVSWRADIRSATSDLEAQLTAAQGTIAQLRTELERAREVVRTVTVAAAQWAVTHNLNRYPAVTVLNVDGKKIEPAVVYTSLNVVTITHGTAMTGTVVLR